MLVNSKFEHKHSGNDIVDSWEDQKEMVIKASSENAIKEKEDTLLSLKIQMKP